MKRAVLLPLTLSFFGITTLIGCGKEPQVLSFDRQTLTKDTTWQGTVQINGDIEVPPGMTLTIKPGTTVKFKRIDEKSDQNMYGVESPYYPQAELIIKGKLIARGTPEKTIVFTSSEIDARPADWGAINLLGSDGNIIEYCKILFAYNGVHGHGAGATINHNEFAKNGVGLSFKKEEETPSAPWFGKICNMEVTYNRFTNNKGGIGFRNSKAVISHNLIQDNKFYGIFPKDDADAMISENEISGNKKGIYLFQAKNVKINNNNIYDNTDYNVAVAEAQDFDVDARRNWFGTINPEKIQESIFDKQDDPEMGAVLIDPILKQKVAWQ
ncbi:MAG: right-handed parallel beta-helix repeat-containing protein [Desulfobulbaceae bacterium]|nr:right-handed parallel beta-helix repeat-containing protein [Desulfobulbaceae bacterium]